MTSDLKCERGRDALTELLRRADVVVENFRTGVLDRLGFSGERIHELDPRLTVLHGRSRTSHSQQPVTPRDYRFS